MAILPLRLGRRARFAAALLAVAAGLAAVNGALNPLVASARPPGFVGQELVYFPSGRFLGEISAGQRELVADLLWIRALQYYGSHRQTDRTYTWAKHLFRVITTLNPRFVEAYRFGALVLATDALDPASAFDLLKEGFHRNPNRWEIPFDLGFLYFLHHEDVLAGTYFRRAAQLPGAPERAVRFAAFALGRGGREEKSRAMWREMRDAAENPTSREIADYALRSLDLTAALDTLSTASSAFERARGTPARSLGDLVAHGFLRRVPRDPFERGFLLDPSNGRVHSVFKTEETVVQTVSSVRETVRLYRQERGAFPASLDALLTQGYMTSIRLPDGFSLRYDAPTGALAVETPALFARAIRAR